MKKQTNKIHAAIEVIDFYLSESMPKHFTEEMTVESVSCDRHGIVFPPSALAALLRWAIRSQDCATSLADRLDRLEE